MTRSAPAVPVAAHGTSQDEDFATAVFAWVRAGWMTFSASPHSQAFSGEGAVSVGGAGSPGLAAFPREVGTGRRDLIPARPKFIEGASCTPAARAHSFPFAVGPPDRGAGFANLRAAGTEVPDDSAARSGFWVIVRVSVFLARDMRAAGSSVSPAKPDLNPSFALRGVPGTAFALNAADAFAPCRPLRMGAASPFSTLFPSTHEKPTPQETLDCV